MSAVNLKAMDVDALLSLRSEIDAALDERARDLQKQLALLTGVKTRGKTGGTGRGSTLKGIKVEPKYRGPNGETWAGRGARPKWLAALLDEGHSLEEFSVESGTEIETEGEEPDPETTSGASRRRRSSGRKKTGRKRG